MELNQKLQELRKQMGLTQEEAAERLYVSRTAVSKWESGRGYPSIDSLKAISRLYSVTIDDLLSSDELITIAEEDHRQKEDRLLDRVFGLLDLSSILLLFLPFFAQREEGIIREVSLLSLTGILPVLRIAFFAVVIGLMAWGILSLVLRDCQHTLWQRVKCKTSLLWNAIGVIVFVITLQPYAAVFLFVFLLIKVLMMLKRP